MSPRNLIQHFTHKDIVATLLSLACWLAAETSIAAPGPVHQRRDPHAAPMNQNSDFDAGAWMDLPSFSGNACRKDNVGTALSPDHRTLSVLFDDFSTQAGGTTGHPLDRKVCRMRIPVHVSSGFQVSIVKTDIRGYANLPGGAQARISTTHHFTRAKGLAIPVMVDRRPFLQETLFQGPYDDSVYIGNHIEEEQTWTPCGEDFSLNVGANVEVRNPSSAQDALTVIDSIELQSQEKGIEYHLFWKKCSLPNPVLLPPRPVHPRPVRTLQTR